MEHSTQSDRDEEDCQRCEHDRLEHKGVCRRDVFVNREWAKCSCEGFVQTL